MNKEFVPYEQALSLKELGFDEPCFGWFILEGDGAKSMFAPEKCPKQDIGLCLAPTFAQAFRWFREKYNWQHSIEPTKDQHRFELGYNYWIWNHITGEEHHTMPKNRPSGDWEYEIYEEAELACLIKLIEIVKEK
jgi:hypothetical protein